MRKRALKDEKCIVSDVRDCDTKVLLIIFIPSHFRQIKDVLTSIFKYIYCSLTSYKNIDVHCLSQYLTSDIIKKNYLFFLTTKSTKFHPCCHSDILVQVTDTLESQFWGICFFSWHSTQKKLQKVSNISITAKYDNVINVTWQCNNYWRFYISLQLQM